MTTPDVKRDDMSVFLDICSQTKCRRVSTNAEVCKGLTQRELDALQRIGFGTTSIGFDPNQPHLQRVHMVSCDTADSVLLRLSRNF